MYIFYLDESGMPDIEDKTPIFCMVGISLNEGSWKTFTRDFVTNKKMFFPEYFKLKEKRDFVLKIEELKAKRLLAPSRKDNRRNIIYVTKALDLLYKYDFQIFPVVILKDRMKFKPNSKWVYPMCVQRLMSKAQKYLQTINNSGIFVLDSRHPNADDALAASHIGYIFSNKFGKLEDRIIELPLFMRSHLSAGLQLADICSYIIYGWYYYLYYSKMTDAIDYSYLAEFWKRISTLLYDFPSNKDKAMLF